MFGRSFKEQNVDSVRLDDTPVTTASLEIILDAIYCAKLHLTTRTIVEVTTAVDFLQLPSFRPMCEQFLIENISTETWSEYYTAATKYQLKDAAIATRAFVTRNFTSLYNGEKFPNLCQESLLDILGAHDSVDEEEIEVLKEPCIWEKSKKENREEVEDTASSSKCSNQRSIPTETIPGTFGQLNLEEGRPKNVLCYTNVDFSENVPKLVFREVGGGHSMRCGTARFPVEVPQKTGTLSRLASGSSFVYVFIHHGKAFQKGAAIFLRYNIQMGTWLILREPPITGLGHMKCCSLSWNATGVYLLLFDSMFCTYEYTIVDDVWKKLPSIPVLVCSMAACCHSRNGIVYAVVADFVKFATQEKRSDLYVYYVEKSEWSSKASTYQAHLGQKLSLVEINEQHLYLLGSMRGFATRIEEYNIENDQWTIVEIPENGHRVLPRDEFWTAFAFGDDLLISAGKFQWDKEEERKDDCTYRKVLLKFNPKAKTLEHVVPFDALSMSLTETPVFDMVVVPT